MDLCAASGPRGLANPTSSLCGYAADRLWKAVVYSGCETKCVCRRQSCRVVPANSFRQRHAQIAGPIRPIFCTSWDLPCRGRLPARTCVDVTDLPYDALIEIDLVCRGRDGAQAVALPDGQNTQSAGQAASSKIFRFTEIPNRVRSGKTRRETEKLCLQIGNELKECRHYPLLRHCERSKAIQNPSTERLWICFVARAPRNEARREWFVYFEAPTQLAATFSLKLQPARARSLDRR